MKWFNTSKGYGFIQRQSGEDVFFSTSEVEDKSLKEGQTVEFEVVHGSKGLQAANIKIAARK